MDECKHKKVFDRDVLISYPPQYQWICEKCGMIESNTLQEGGYPGLPGRFKEVYDKFHKKDIKDVER